jgi:predicted transporter
VSHAPSHNSRHQLITLLVILAALLVGAGGFVHLREWLDTYRHVPSSVPGAAVVRVGFPINAATSLVIALALVATIWRFGRHTTAVAAGAIAFQAASLGTLILSRTGSVFGWKEPVWTDGANQARAVEIAALIALVGVIAVERFVRTGRRIRSTGHGVPSG